MSDVLNALKKRLAREKLERSLLPVEPFPFPLTREEQGMADQLHNYFDEVAEKHGIDLGDSDLGEWDGPDD